MRDGRSIEHLHVESKRSWLRGKSIYSGGLGINLYVSNLMSEDL